MKDARSDPVRSAAGGHLHLWSLPDGTGLHAPLGRLSVDPDDHRVCCHLCGRWFHSLGSHVRTHGHTAETYRADLGLCRGDALTSSGLSARIAERQRVRYATEPSVRETLAAGQRRARTGELGRLAWASRGGPGRATAEARQDAGRAAGRRTREERRQAHLAGVLRAAGLPDLDSLLRARYAAGASLESLARETGLGRSRLREAVVAAGISLRSRGHTTSAGRSSRARTAEDLAALRVGTDDLTGWLRSRRRAGWTLTQLGDAVGHSHHWVRWRLEAA